MTVEEGAAPESRPAGEAAPATDDRPELQIRELTLRDLAEALADDSLWQGPVHPITRHRALAQLKNPRADPDDVVLLIAYEKGEIVGYLGVLPDRVIAHGHARKIGWASCWWVDPARAGMSGFLLLMRAMRAYPEGFGACGYTKKAAAVYDRMPQFQVFSEKQGVIGFFRLRGMVDLGADRLPRVRPFAPLLRVLASPLDWALGLVQGTWARRSLRRKALRFEYLPEIDDEAAAFIEDHRRDELLKRGKAEFDWMLRHPWILRAPVPDRNAEKYAFSATARDFHHFCCKVLDAKGAMIAVVILRLRDGELSMPYAYWREGAEHEVVRALLLHAVATDCESFRLYNPTLVSCLKRYSYRLFLPIPATRRMVVTKRLARAEGLGRYIQDGDADNGFT